MFFPKTYDFTDSLTLNVSLRKNLGVTLENHLYDFLILILLNTFDSAPTFGKCSFHYRLQ